MRPLSALPWRGASVHVVGPVKRVLLNDCVAVTAEDLRAPRAGEFGAAVLIAGAVNPADHCVAAGAVVVTLRPCKRALGGCRAVVHRADERLTRVLGLGLAAQAARLHTHGVGVTPGTGKGVEVRHTVLVACADAGHTGRRLLEDEGRRVVLAPLGQAGEHPERAVPACSCRNRGLPEVARCGRRDLPKEVNAGELGHVHHVRLSHLGLAAELAGDREDDLVLTHRCWENAQLCLARLHARLERSRAVLRRGAVGSAPAGVPLNHVLRRRLFLKHLGGQRRDARRREQVAELEDLE